MDDLSFPIIELPANADTPEAAVQVLLAELVRVGSLSVELAAGVASQVWLRERLGSTAIGRGVAIPCAQVPELTEPVGVVGRCVRPLDWPGAIDVCPVELVCLLVIHAGTAGHWFPALRQLVEQLRQSQWT